MLILDPFKFAAPETVVTWNPSDKNAGVALSNGNLTATVAGGSVSVRGTQGRSGSGKRYYEIHVDAGSDGGGVDTVVGVGSAAALLTTYVGNSNHSFGWWGNPGASTFYASGTGSSASYAAGYVTGDVIGIMLDLDSNQIGFSRQGVDKGIAGSVTAGQTYYPMVSHQNGGKNTAHFAAASLLYLPSGYSAWGA